jgi:hypothetical protein
MIIPKNRSREIKSLQFVILALCLLFFHSVANGDNPPASVRFRAPLDIPLSLSGSFGELRATHFHSGVDFRVGGVVGASVLSAGSGYVSRISVSPVGYGNAVYVDHPDGRTTLYGHLHDFAPEIAKWVREQQYLRESFAVNLYPEPSLFPVKSGQFLGRAGNSGSSGGPHLHFEIRNTEDQLPLNPLPEASLKVTDNMPPFIQRVSLYSIMNAAYLPERSLIRSFTGQINDVISVTDTFYVAAAGYDRQNNTAAKLAVKEYNYYLNDKLVFSFTPKNIPFGQGRYINSIVEYSQKQQTGLSMVKSWVEPGGALRENIKVEGDGLFVLNSDQVHTVKVEMKDEHGNRSAWSFRVKGGAAYPSSALNDSTIFKRGRIMPWFIPNRFEGDGIRFMLGPGSLYSTILFDADTLTVRGTRAWRVHSKNTPIHNSARVAMRADFPDSLKDKALIVTLDDKGGISAIGGSYSSGWIEANASSFGVFMVALDTIPPVITPGFKEGENLSGRSYLRFTVRDNLSGVSDIKVFIDDRWILSAYDPKNRRVETELRSDKIKRGTKHKIEISVSDNRGNINNFKSSFVW